MPVKNHCGMIFLSRLVFCVAIVFLAGNKCPGSPGLHLTNITVKDGLSNLNVTSITQDHLGYMWVATMRGLNRFNGSEFTHYFYNPKDSNSINSNHLNTILCTGKGLVYVGSTNGLNVYDEKLDIFENPFPVLNNTNISSLTEKNDFVYITTLNKILRFKPSEPKLEEIGKNLSGNLIINMLFFDNVGKLWCCFDNASQIACYDEQNDVFDFYQLPFSQEYKSNNSVKSFFQISGELLILSTKNGVFYFDIKQRKFVFPSDYSTLSKGLDGTEIWFVMEKEPLVYWIGTYRSGIFVYDKTKNTLTRHFLNDISSEIHSNTYLNYFTDRFGNVWLASFDAGLDVSYKQAKNFNFDPVLNQITGNIFVTGIAQDKSDKLVIATRENGFYVYDPKNKTHQNYNLQNSKLSYPYIRSIYVDSVNHYWIGHHYGMQLFFPESKTFKSLAIPEPNNGVVTILQAGRRIFVGTDRQGLLIFDLNGQLLKQLETYGNNITKIIRLNQNEILFSSFSAGNFIMNLNTLTTQRLDLRIGGVSAGSDNSITLHCKDGKHLWLGTYNFGLFSYDLVTREFKNFSVSEGLPSSDIVGIEEDDGGNLWLSTSYGLARFSTADSSVQTYFVNDGIVNYQFHEKASFKARDGVIYFGGNSGLTYFLPSEMYAGGVEAPEIVLEKLFLQNKLVVPKVQGSTLKQALQHTREITFTHKDKLFSIEYVGLDFLSSGALQYYYMLDGFDKEWYNVGNQRRVTYSNLSRGTYVFKVKAKNRSGEWSKNQAELVIHVKPAPWFSYLAWTIYFLIIASIAIVIVRLRIKTFIYKKNLENEHYEHLREREINGMKQKFFTNISHELRTPLTLIYGLVTQLSQQEKLSPKLKDYIQSLDMNVNRLLKLINQLLTFKKIESESLTLWLENENINEVILQIVGLFSLYAKEKEIRIDVLEENSYIFCFDKDKLEKILSNLLSNAIKHTDKGGKIEVVIRKISGEKVRMQYAKSEDVKIEEYVEICVTDDGTGIEEKDWDTIFNRYKQIESDGRIQPDYSGTGIGLNFTKSLIELHKGKIRMESKVGHGTAFCFLLPYDQSVYEPGDFADLNRIEASKIAVNNFISVNDSESLTDIEIQPDFEKTVLVVEDDLHLNKFLVNSIKKYYNVISSHDGEAGLKLINQYLPDIVVSDVMMPKIDGFELTKKIKENKELCHLPVILLTSKSETSSQIEGLQSGADFYIAKPFNLNFLLSAIESQLKNRKRIQEMFMGGMIPNLNKLDINQLDLNFLRKLNQILEKELSNTDLDISHLAKSLNMGRSSFYRKFLSLTSLSPVSYIRKFRINKSVELMASGNYTLSEISDMTGFSSQSYFSTAFRQEKNVTPSEFMSSNYRSKT
jgi:signal transduction histidine kinase/DNA-binding response OmpR family regulator/ligand-binding sensor domain-containing protein